MKKRIKRILDFFKLIHLPVILLIIVLYLLLCLYCFFALRANGQDTPFREILAFNLLTITGNDYIYVDSPLLRVAGVLVLLLGMVGLSSIMGYISSAFVARRLNLERGVKKMQKMKEHIIICGWKNDIKGLILGILRKNKDRKASDIILINNADDVKVQNLRDDEELQGLMVLRGDFTEEQTLLNANIKEASKVLIIGENQENLGEELVDSRVFAGTLLARKLNGKCHICAEIRTERYKNYLENQNCAEVIYVDEYTRYILSTSTNYGGMSKVMSSFLDNGDGVSVQIAPIASVIKAFRAFFLPSRMASANSFSVVAVAASMPYGQVLSWAASTFVKIVVISCFSWSVICSISGFLSRRCRRRDAARRRRCSPASCCSRPR